MVRVPLGSTRRLQRMHAHGISVFLQSYASASAAVIPETKTLKAPRYPASLAAGYGVCDPRCRRRHSTVPIYSLLHDAQASFHMAYAMCYSKQISIISLFTEVTRTMASMCTYYAVSLPWCSVSPFLAIVCIRDSTSI